MVAFHVGFPLIVKLKRCLFFTSLAVVACHAEFDIPSQWGPFSKRMVPATVGFVTGEIVNHRPSRAMRIGIRTFLCSHIVFCEALIAPCCPHCRGRLGRSNRRASHTSFQLSAQSFSLGFGDESSKVSRNLQIVRCLNGNI